MSQAEVRQTESVQKPRTRRRWRRALLIVASLALALVVVLLVSLLVLQSKLGGGERLKDQSTAAVTLPSFTEIVADLDYPPGNIAVSSTGRTFITFHPSGAPPLHLAELRGVLVEPYPRPDSETAKRMPTLRTPLAVRIDQQNRLWVLDYGYFGITQPRLLAFDLNHDILVEQYDFPRNVAGFLSMLNDFQVDPAGRMIYVADTSPILQNPALVVYDRTTDTSRRLLEGHPALQAQDVIIQAPGRDMQVLGMTLRIGLDSITLDDRGEWLYFGPLSGDRLYRIATKDLNDQSLTPAELAEKVEDYGPKPISDGLSIDEFNNVYITDPEHSAVLMLDPDGRLTTLVKDSPFRWPDGLSFGPDGWLYVTCSALHQVQFLGNQSLREHAPYQIIRFKPGAPGVPGH